MARCPNCGRQAGFKRTICLECERKGLAVLTGEEIQQLARRREAARAITRAAVGGSRSRPSTQGSIDEAATVAPLLPGIGGFVFVVGIIWLVVALNMDTTVSVEGRYLGIDRVHNVGLMNQRTNHTIAASAITVVGALLGIAGILRERRS